MAKRKLLFITEGDIDEPKFIETIYKKCFPNVEYEIYSYATTIHTLTKLIFKIDNEIDNFLDIKNVLKENEKQIDKREILSKSYSDIVLVFHFEPHCDTPEFKKIFKMLEFFDDATNNGKLYINYPMMQAYKHICSYPQEDIEFRERKINVYECKDYKELVNKESCIKDLRKYNYPIIIKILEYNLKKVNYILNNKYDLPFNSEEFIKLDLKQIYVYQLKNMDKYNWVYILNTFIFHIVEYNPKIFLEKIKSLS